MKCDDILLYEYLAGELGPGEAEMTAAHLEECEPCQERFRVMVALDNPRMIETRGRSRSETRRIKDSAWKMGLAAAGVMLALLISLLYNILPIPPGSEGDPGTLASVEPYPLVILETRASSGADLSRGLRLYRDGRYREAVSEMEKHGENAEALFFSGVSLYLIDEPGRALEKLVRAGRISDKWAEPSGWYRAQCLLKLGQTSEALVILKRLSEYDNRYREEARELIRRIGP